MSSEMVTYRCPVSFPRGECVHQCLADPDHWLPWCNKPIECAVGGRRPFGHRLRTMSSGSSPQPLTILVNVHWQIAFSGYAETNRGTFDRTADASVCFHISSGLNPVYVAYVIHASLRAVWDTWIIGSWVTVMS